MVAGITVSIHVPRSKNRSRKLTVTILPDCVPRTVNRSRATFWRGGHKTCPWIIPSLPRGTRVSCLARGGPGGESRSRSPTRPCVNRSLPRQGNARPDMPTIRRRRWTCARVGPVQWCRPRWQVRRSPRASAELATQLLTRSRPCARTCTLLRIRRRRAGLRLGAGHAQPACAHRIHPQRRSPVHRRGLLRY